MNERKTDDEDERFPVTPEPAAPPLAAKVVVSQDQQAECTIFPPGASGAERLTTWITATEDSFVRLDDMR